MAPPAPLRLDALQLRLVRLPLLEPFEVSFGRMQSRLLFLLRLEAGVHFGTGRLISPAMELVRLAIPRRVYTQSHIDYVIEVVLDVFARRASLPGYAITEEAPILRHFTAKFAPLSKRTRAVENDCIRRRL